MTVSLPRFFHQCEVPESSGRMSPALCTIGSTQLEACSTISPCCTKIRAGRSSWLCQGTMPPGSMVSLRKRSSRPSMCAGCLPRSMAPSVTSVTPTGLETTICWGFGFNLSAGHAPAETGCAESVNTPRMARPGQTARNNVGCLNIGRSPVLAATAMVVGYVGTFVERALVLKCSFALAAIDRRYRARYALAIEPIGDRHFRFPSDWRSMAGRARLAGVHVNPEEHLMTKLSRTLIATAAFAVIT